MGDDANPQVDPPAADPPAAPVPDDVAALKTQLAAAQAQLADFRATLTAMREAPPAAPVTTAPPPQSVVDMFRPALRQRGWTDEVIEQNVSIIMPILELAAAPILQAISSQLGTINQNYDFLRAPTDKKTFQHWDVLADAIAQERDLEARAGRMIDAKTAYQRALANNYGRIEADRQSRAQAGASAADAHTQAGLASPKTAGAVDRTDHTQPQSVKDILALPDADRQNAWDGLGDIPIG